VQADSWNEESTALLRLSLVPGIGPRGAKTLLEAFGNARAVFDAPCAQIDARVVDEAHLARAMRWREDPGHHIVTWDSASYPALLREIADPPLVLYVKGDTAHLNRPAVAIVGSRNATAQGRSDAFEFARALSQAGLCIVSGMALGIDASAHEGGLAGASSSIAVLGTGIDRIYPQRNRALAERLERAGCLVSDFALGTAPLPGNFPARNRLISGLARGVLVVEAAPQSGSLVTAKSALEQGREVFAMPGSIHSPLAKGCHQLIREGAKITECVEDILEELGMESQRLPVRDTLRARRDPVLEAMGFAPISLEQLAAASGLGVAKIAESLTRLEIEGRIAILAGGLFQRTSHNASSR
jgi:DNA processing protein